MDVFFQRKQNNIRSIQVGWHTQGAAVIIEVLGNFSGRAGSGAFPQEFSRNPGGKAFGFFRPACPEYGFYFHNFLPRKIEHINGYTIVQVYQYRALQRQVLYFKNSRRGFSIEHKGGEGKKRGKLQEANKQPPCQKKSGVKQKKLAHTN